MNIRALIASAAAASLLAIGGASADPVKIRIAWVVPIANWASIIYEKKDLMPNYGKSYVAEAVHFQSTPTMITALGAGELEIADLAYSSFAIAVQNAGMTGLRIIADEAKDGYDDYTTGDFVVLNDGPVKTIEDLKGKTVATPGIGSAVDIPVRVILKKHGLEAPRDYTVVEAPFPSMAAMLIQQKVALIPTVAPFSFDPQLKAAHTLFTTKEALGGDTEFIIWAAQADFIAKHRAAMVDMLEDTLRVAHWLTDPANHAAVVEIASRLVKQPPERVNYVFTKADAYHDPTMMPDMKTFQRALDAQFDAGFMNAPLEGTKYADLSLLKAATARLK
jgi:sulfonate transport system substrate-binding protein